MKFSIRDLLLVTVIVALALGWWLDGSRLAAEIDRLKPKAWPSTISVQVLAPNPKP